MDQSANQNAAQDVQPDLVNNLEHLIAAEQNPILARHCRCVDLDQFAGKDKGFDVFFHLQAADRRAANDRQNQADDDIGNRDLPVEDAGQEQD